ncbi:HAD-IA family hydrolase [Lachnoclostridium phytofermentans]|uniref:HAD-superfamily hydrolase, subfamily IA, variant 1 n=1 Tax=Lachnoclostridium phytofermentans (strain ATCC 700394 / DSM 18823 / ISDg) TaxID=357809 RepID=A9KSG5_LACP7|nr:HAD-IA family hydrolase [Lachnoclostridium phytofermentans]ABX43617.1 HAD-superfamily hydrolase, subfamily IA, variant 1 [Lachnoclostridium phytofermentans ISDg]
MNYDYILFDLDGTLTDPKLGITKSFAYALEHFDIHIENLDSLCKYIGPPIVDSFMDFGFSKEKALEAIDKYREYFKDYGIYENEVYKGVVQLLATLRSRNKKIMLATSKPEVFAKQILEHFELLEYFDFVGGSELNGDRSEKSEVIQYVLKEGKVTDLTKAVMIGDRKYDIFGAKEVGIDSIGVLNGYGDQEELIAAGADAIVASVWELVNREEFL